jgi:glutathione synthase/RimK-type ligase-like ATP-grasp enzyme
MARMATGRSTPPPENGRATSSSSKSFRAQIARRRRRTGNRFRRIARRLPGLRGVAANLDATRAERNRLRRERDELRRERDELRGERDELRGERDELRGEHDGPAAGLVAEQPRRASHEQRPHAAQFSFEKTFNKVQTRLLSTARKQARYYGDDVARELWSRGFLPDKSQLYEIDRHGPDVYVSDLQREMTRVVNGPVNAILGNKVVFNELFGAVVPTVPVLGYTNGRRFSGVIPERCRLFAKPLTGGGGTGVFCARVESGRVIVGDRSLSESEFINELFERKKSYILTPAIEVHPEIKELFDGTTNTLRVLMMRRPATGEGFIATAALRVGTKASGDVDNFTAGGISFVVDVGSGEIGKGRQKNGTVSEVHPDTGMRITGRRVPMWDRVVQVCDKAFEHCQHVNYVGWDIIVTPRGPVVLEGNHYSNPDILQVHTPLLSDDRVKDFYEHHGILEWQPTEGL